MPVLSVLLSLAAGSLAPVGIFPLEMDPGGCRLERIAGVVGENHVLFRGVSPNGRYLALGWDRGRGAQRERGAYLLDLVTGARRDLPAINNAASFSPDGERLVSANYPGPAGRGMEIVELDLRSGRNRALASDEASEWLPSYSPDGEWVIFNSTRSGASDLYRVHVRLGTLQRLTEDPRYDAHAQFSRDGRSVIFHRQIRENNYALAVLDIATHAVVELPGTTGEEAYPAYSPDERWIAYGSDVGQNRGMTDLYVMHPDGSGRRRLTTHPDKDAYPTFSPDGRHLYFMRQGPSGVAIYRLTFVGSDCVRS